MSNQSREAIAINFIALRGGGVSYAYEMTKALSKNAFCVCIISSEMENYKRWLDIENIDVVTVLGYSSKMNFLIRLASFFLNKRRYIQILKKYDVRKVYIPMASYWTLFVNGLFKKASIIYTCHDPEPHVRRTYIANYINNRLLKKSSKIVVLSEQFIPYICNKYNKETSGLLQLGFSTQDYYKSTNKPCMVYDHNKANFLFYGHIRENKGLDILAKSYELVYKSNPNVTLTIAGNGDFSSYRDTFNKLSNVNYHIRWIKDEEVMDFFAHKSVIVVLPYKTATQSGIIPIAMHFGKPIIASNVSGIQEQIIDGFSGLLVKPLDYEDLASKMLYLSLNQSKREELSRNSYNEIRKTSWESQASKLIKFIEED